MSLKPNWDNLKYNIISAILLAMGVWILRDSMGLKPTIGVLLVALSVYFGVKGGWGFSSKKKKEEDKK